MIKKLSTLYLPLLLLISCTSCNTNEINEKYAEEKVKKSLSLKDHVQAKKLHGGISGSQLFVVSSEDKKYVIRFLIQKNQRERNQEITCSAIASQQGYGPRIFFTDPKQEFVIMEYLPNEPITQEQKNTAQLYEALADVLRKIHSGPAYPTKLDLFDKMQETIATLTVEKQVTTIAWERIQKAITLIHKTLLPYLTSAPCHNEISPNNLIFFENKFKAIDYETAAQNDPYVDLATVCMHYCTSDEQENLFLSAYLNKTHPSAKEKAKLYLMKQIVLIYGAIEALVFFPTMKLVYGNKNVNKDIYEKFLKELAEKNNYPVSPEELGKLMISSITNSINSFMTNIETQAFLDALNSLR